MAKKPKKPSAGSGAARQKAAAAQSRHRPRGDFGLAALREVTSQNDFSMRDEARNTGHRSSPWGGDTRLRAKPIGFVSAGLIEPLKDESQNMPEDLSSKGRSDNGNAMEDPVLQAPSALVSEQKNLTLEASEQSHDLTEATASPDPAVAMTPGTPAADVPHTDSVGFVIDVTGDKTLSANLTNSPPRMPDPEPPAEESDSSSEVILFKGRGNANRGREPVDQKRTDRPITLDTIRYETKAVETNTPLAHTSSPNHAMPLRTRPGRQPRRGKSMDIDDEEEAIIADYIANMAEDSDDLDELPPQKSFLSGDLGADNADFGDGTSDSAASDDDHEGDPAIDGDNVMDPQDSDGNGLASPTLDDETLARLLAKQEELGMGSDELASDAAGSWHHASALRRSRPGKGVIPRNQGPFPSASAVADAFDDLDLMDWERPSLQNERKRGRRAQPPVFGLSDSETEQRLQTAWQNDRESKKSRKMRREEMRAQGLLGKHSDPDDPRLRYPTGMSLDDIKMELRAFLEGSEPRRELPPMGKASRKTLHELARVFKVKSQSIGSGDQRRPTLIRTKYTATYTEEHLELVMSGVGRKYFPRLDSKGKGRATQKISRGGAGNAAVTYQEGEVVGASAPELGQENKGRTMLEKMGWSSGMGLGSLDNKGILQPVAHVVKRSKAGLG